MTDKKDTAPSPAESGCGSKPTNETTKSLALAAWITAVIALCVSIWQAYVGQQGLKDTREHQRLSVRPALAYHHGWVDDNSFVGITIANDGIGPAMVDPFTIKSDGQLVENWDAAIAALGIDNKDNWLTTFTIHEGGVPLKEGASRHVFGLVADDDDYSEKRRKIVEQATDRISIHATYWSMYDEQFD